MTTGPVSCAWAPTRYKDKLGSYISAGRPCLRGSLRRSQPRDRVPTGL